MALYRFASYAAVSAFRTLRSPRFPWEFIPTSAREAMSIVLKRAYDTASKEDGFRILVERLWPRGLSKQAAKIDLWAKQVAPSTELRRWFNHQPEKWLEFKRRYFVELAAQEDLLKCILGRVRRQRVTFVFASRELRFNNAVALKQYLEGAAND